MIKEAKIWGYHVIASDMNPDAPGLELADEPVTIDTYDDKAHVRHAKWLQDHGRNIVGVSTCGADVAYTVSRVAEALGLPGLRCQSSRKMRDKALVRYDLAFEWQVFQPEFKFERVDQLIRNANGYTYPCVVKPTMERASRGVTLVDKAAIMPLAMTKVKPFAQGGMCLVEERLYGTEHSAELIFVGKDRPCFFNVVDRIFDYKNGVAMEIGHINPTRLATSEQVRIKNMMMKAADVLGVNWGPFKCDIIYTRNEDGDPIMPKILEACARLSGGFDCQATTPISQGRNPIRALIELSVGDDPSEDSLRLTEVRYAACVASFPVPGRIVSAPSSFVMGEDTNPLQEAYKLTGVDEIHLIAEIGQDIVSYEHCADRAAFVIAHAEGYDEAWNIAQTGAGIITEGYETERIPNDPSESRAV